MFWISVAETGDVASLEKHTCGEKLGDIFNKLDKMKEMNKKQSLISGIKDRMIEIKMRDRTGETRNIVRLKSFISLITNPNKIVPTLRNVLNRITFFREEIFLNTIFKTHINNNVRVDHILKLRIDDSTKDLVGERDLPSSERFQKNGWYKKMLLRYGLAMYFSKGKDILETCSGLGWGAYLLDGVANSVTCIEIDKKTINLSKQLWKTDKVKYINGSVLKIPVKDNKYDVVTAMESIEHFKLEDIKIYLSEIYRVLKIGGILIGSSGFPDTRKEEADTLCSTNKYHLHICTNSEIIELLRKQGFKKIKVFRNKLFFMARK